MISLAARLLSLTALACISGTEAAHSRRRVVVVRNGPSEPRYDRSITTFDPSGRLLQVEYSLEAANRGEGVSAALTDEGNILMMATSSQKVHRLDEHLWLLTAGLSGDARALASHLRARSREHRLAYGEQMTVKEAAEEAAGIQHTLTTTAGARPLGCTAIVLGMDPTYKDIGKPRIFRTDPGGILEDCLFCCAGKNQIHTMLALQERYDIIRSGSLGDAMKAFLACNLEHSDKEEGSAHDLWVVAPKAKRRGKTKPTCFLGVTSDAKFDEMSERCL